MPTNQKIKEAVDAAKEDLKHYSDSEITMIFTKHLQTLITFTEQAIEDGKRLNFAILNPIRFKSLILDIYPLTEAKEFVNTARTAIDAARKEKE